MTLIWKRPCIEDTIFSKWKTWRSRCGGYKIVHKALQNQFYPMVMRMNGDQPHWWDGIRHDDSGSPIGVQNFEEAALICEEHNG